MTARLNFLDIRFLRRFSHFFSGIGRQQQHQQQQQNIMFMDYHNYLRSRTLSFLSVAPILAPFFLQRFVVLSMTTTTAAGAMSSSSSSSQNNIISGRCLCGAVAWSISSSTSAASAAAAEEAAAAATTTTTTTAAASSRPTTPTTTTTIGTQVLVCHCDYCRRQSGSWHIPWLAVPRAGFVFGTSNGGQQEQREREQREQQQREQATSTTTTTTTCLTQHPAVSEYSASNIAKRGFCRHCGSTLYMDYMEEHTLWVAMGTLLMDNNDDNNDNENKNSVTAAIPVTLCAARDCHIYVNKRAKKQQEDIFAKVLPYYPDFGTYRPDPCQPITTTTNTTATGTSWRDLPTWRQVDTIASFVKKEQEEQESAKNTDNNKKEQK